MPSIDVWYAALSKPFFSPPNWVFAPVWVVLFAMMGASFYVFLKAKRGHGMKMQHAKANPLIGTEATVFYLQLALNILWSVIFFGLKMPRLAFFEMLALWLCILFNLLLFARVSRKSALLLVPYLLWVSFALGLNFSIAILN
jgi:tryptophan-rich sensory protein